MEFSWNLQVHFQRTLSASTTLGTLLNGNQGNSEWESVQQECKHDGVCATGTAQSPHCRPEKKDCSKQVRKSEGSQMKMGRIKRKDRVRQRMDHIWYKIFWHTDTRQAKRFKIYVN